MCMNFNKYMQIMYLHYGRHLIVIIDSGCLERVARGRPVCSLCSLSSGCPERVARGRFVCPSCSLSSSYPERVARGRLVPSVFYLQVFCCLLGPWHKTIVNSDPPLQFHLFTFCYLLTYDKSPSTFTSGCIYSNCYINHHPPTFCVIHKT